MLKQSSGLAGINITQTIEGVKKGINMKHRIFKFLIVIITIVVIILFPINSALAIATPTTCAINSIYAFRNVDETSDMLFLVDETTTYLTLPAENAYSAILTIMYKADGVTQVAISTIYAFHTAGYGRSIVAFYLNAASVTSNGLTWLDAVNFKVYGNPTLTWAPTAPATVLTHVSYWSTETAKANVQSELASRIIVMMQTLDTSWGTAGTTDSLLTNTTDGVKLSSIGQAYILGVLPGVNVIAPDAFSVVVTAPDIHKKVYGNAGALATAAQLLLTPFDFTGLGAKLGISIGWLNSIITLGIIVLIDWQFIKNHLMGTRGIVMIDDFIFIAATVSGALPLMIVLGGAVAAAFFTLNVFFLSKANT
jgi:hypothetical protein